MPKTRRPIKRRRPAKTPIEQMRLLVEEALALARRNADAINRLEQQSAVHLRRCGELQFEIDELKKVIVPLTRHRSALHLPERT